MNAPVMVLPDGSAWCEAAVQLARHLGLPCIDDMPSHGLVLVIGDDGLRLDDAGSPREQALQVDFTGGPMGFRQRQGFRHDELLPRAVGIKGGVRPVILDATAGLGRDAFMLASMGCELSLFERHPVVHALLEDGLRRAGLREPALAPTLDRMRLLSCDSIESLSAGTGAAVHDVIFLDPMFPERSKSALVKKPMRLFHALVGADEDSGRLLEMALPVARRRVVVKRPLHAPPLAGRAPHLDFRGKAVRFDVYLTPQQG